MSQVYVDDERSRYARNHSLNEMKNKFGLRNSRSRYGLKENHDKVPSVIMKEADAPIHGDGMMD